jgi:hypothetical protein
MFSSLWYVVTSSNPQTAKNQKDVSLQYGKGTYIGVAWLLQKFKGQAKPGISYAPDDVWPGINAVPA